MTHSDQHTESGTAAGGLFSPANAWLFLSLGVALTFVLALGRFATLLNYPRDLAFMVAALLAIDYHIWSWGIEQFELRGDGDGAPSHDRLYSVVGGVVGSAGAFVLGKGLVSGSTPVAVGGGVVMLLGLYLLATADRRAEDKRL